VKKECKSINSTNRLFLLIIGSYLIYEVMHCFETTLVPILFFYYRVQPSSACWRRWSGRTQSGPAWQTTWRNTGSVTLSPATSGRQSQRRGTGRPGTSASRRWWTRGHCRWATRSLSSSSKTRPTSTLSDRRSFSKLPTWEMLLICL